MVCILGGLDSRSFSLPSACVFLADMYNLVLGLFGNFTACHAQFAKQKMVILCRAYTLTHTHNHHMDYVFCICEWFCQYAKHTSTHSEREMSNRICQTVSIFFFSLCQQNAKITSDNNRSGLASFFYEKQSRREILLSSVRSLQSISYFDSSKNIDITLITKWAMDSVFFFHFAIHVFLLFFFIS